MKKFILMLFALIVMCGCEKDTIEGTLWYCDNGSYTNYIEFKKNNHVEIWSSKPNTKAFGTYTLIKDNYVRFDNTESLTLLRRYSGASFTKNSLILYYYNLNRDWEKIGREQSETYLKR